MRNETLTDQFEAHMQNKDIAEDLKAVEAEAYGRGWNDAIKAAAEACRESGEMAKLAFGKDEGSGTSFAMAVETLSKPDE